MVPFEVQCSVDLNPGTNFGSVVLTSSIGSNSG